MKRRLPLGRIRETITTLAQAARYSFSFCWRSNKSATIARLILSATNTVLIYLGIQTGGMVINAVQSSIGTLTATHFSFIVFYKSAIFAPVVYTILLSITATFVARFNWFIRSTWSQTLRYANQKEINDHKGSLDVARFKSKELDDLTKRISELPSSWQTRIYFSEEMMNLSTTLISFVMFGSSLLWYKPIYAFGLVLVTIPMAIVQFNLVALWWNLSQELVPEHKKRYILEKPYNGPNTFVQAKIFNQMPVLRKEIDLNVGGILEAHKKMRTKDVKWELSARVLSVLGLGLVVTDLVWSAASGQVPIGTMTVILAASRTFQGNLDSLVSLIAEQWNSAKGIILIEKDFFGMKPVVTTEYPVVPKFDKAPDLVFSNVHFSYPNTNVEVLTDVSFTIKRGSKVAIVGGSGNGKSTLQALMSRYYDPTKGSITAGGINLRNIKTEDWCNVISSLTQKYTILERQLGEEIASSRLDQPIDRDNLIASAKFAGFMDVVNNDPKGFDSQIGTEFGGREFSGGEEQRVALARVRYRGTKILILDEPDASLDPETAEEVINQIFSLDDVTVVMITHHVSRAQRCDDIIVMGKGKVVEQGNHTDLMSKKGTYSKLYKKDLERIKGVSVSPDDF